MKMGGACSMIVLCLVSSFASAETLTIPITEDQSTLNYWTAGQYGLWCADVGNMGVGYIASSGIVLYVYLKFDLAEIPENATINSAELLAWIWVANNPDSMELRSHYVQDDSWNEAQFVCDPNALNWYDRPEIPTMFTDGVVVDHGDDWYSWDVTDAVIDAWADDGVITLALKFADDPDVERATASLLWAFHTNAHLAIEYGVTIPVDIDIKPGSYPNCINVNGQGVIPVAILGSESFNVAEIDPDSLTFGGLSVRVKNNGTTQCSIEDVNADGWQDLVCQFEDDPSAWLPGEGTADVVGYITGGQRFEGSDGVCIVP